MTRLTRFQSARTSMARDFRNFQQNKVSKILGHHIPNINSPTQWSDHVNRANAITNLVNPPGGVLMALRRYLPVQITRGRR